MDAVEDFAERAAVDDLHYAGFWVGGHCTWQEELAGFFGWVQVAVIHRFLFVFKTYKSYS